MNGVMKKEILDILFKKSVARDRKPPTDHAKARFSSPWPKQILKIVFSNMEFLT